MADDPPATILDLATGVAGDELCHLRLDRPHEQRPRALDFGERIGERPWLGKRKNVRPCGRI